MLIATGTNQGGSPRACAEARRTLCRAFCVDPAHAECEIALKGGQIGAPNFFGAVQHSSVQP